MPENTLNGEPLVSRRDVQNLPSARHALRHRFEKADAIERQGLKDAQREHVPHVKSRRPLFYLGIERILRRGLQNCACRGRQSAQHGARIVQRFRKRIAGLQVQSDARLRVACSGLKRVVTRMRAVAHDRFRPESADGVSGGIELREARKLRIGAGISVGKEYGRQMDTSRAYVSCIQLHAMEVVIDACRVGCDVPVAKMPRDRPGVEQLYLVPRRDRCQIVLETLQIYGGVCGHLGTVSARKQRLPGGAVGSRQRHGRDGILKRHGSVRSRGDDRLKDQRKRAGHEIVLPQVRQNRGHRGAGVERGALCHREVDRKPRPPAIAIDRIHRLRIVEIDLRCARREKG